MRPWKFHYIVTMVESYLLVPKMKAYGFYQSVSGEVHAQRTGPHSVENPRHLGTFFSSASNSNP